MVHCVLYSGRPFPKNCTFSRSRGPFWVNDPNGITIGSAVFAQVAAECPYTLQWAPLSPKIACSHGRSGNQSNTWFLGPIRAYKPNGISVGSAVFAQITAECPYTLLLFIACQIGDVLNKATRSRPWPKFWPWCRCHTLEAENETLVLRPILIPKFWYREHSWFSHSVTFHVQWWRTTRRWQTRKVPAVLHEPRTLSPLLESVSLSSFSSSTSLSCMAEAAPIRMVIAAKD